MWEAALEMFLSNPVFGVGTGDYYATISSFVDSGRLPDFILKYTQPHNMYLFTLSTNGLIGLFTLLFIFYSIIKLAKKSIRLFQRERLFGFIALSVALHYMISGFTESVLNIHMLICSFAFIMGVSLRGRDIKTNKVQNL
jgi:O-antigen ligase